MKEKLLLIVITLAMFLTTISFADDSTITLNPQDCSSKLTLSNGNLTVTRETGDGAVRATAGFSTGKHYWEVKCKNYVQVGVMPKSNPIDSESGVYIDRIANSIALYKYVDVSYIAYNRLNGITGPGFTENDVLGVALDMDNRTISYYLNGKPMPYAINLKLSDYNVNDDILYPTFEPVLAGSSLTVNFGATPFAYTAPDGYVNKPAIPNAPLDLTASLTAESTVSLKWSEVTEATSYTVKRSSTQGQGYSVIASGVNTSTFVDKDVVAGSTYYYVVSANSAAGDSGNSNEASISVPQKNNNNAALVVITFKNGSIKEFDMTGSELDRFLNWYDARSNGSGKTYYTIVKTYNLAKFTSRKVYIQFNEIYDFEVMAYEN